MRRLGIFPTAAWLSLLLLAALGQAQSPAPPREQEKPPVRVTTRLVQLNVVVRDRDGKPVSDLQREDFQVLEEGQPQNISVFAVETNAAPSRAATPPPPGTFSNQTDVPGSRPASVTVILLDGLNTRFEDQAYARSRIIKFLEQIQPEDRVALYTLGTSLRVLHDFTSDARPLLAALGRYHGAVPTTLMGNETITPDTGDAAFDAFFQSDDQQMTDFRTANRIGRTLEALEAIANHLAGFPGRKNLVWVSSSFPIQIGVDRASEPNLRIAGTMPLENRTFSKEIERAVRALSNANVAVYPVDARGLLGMADMDPAFNPSRPPMAGGRVLGAGRGYVTGQFSNSIDSMQHLADRTGGRAFYNTNDIQGAIRRAIDDSRVTYVLGYYPASAKWDGKFRKVRVSVKRPGLTVHTRSGYLALPDRPQTDEQARSLMRAAAWNPLDATALGLTIKASRYHAAASDVVKIEMNIATPDVRLELQDGHYTGAIEFVFVQRLENGEASTSSVYRQEIRLTPVDYKWMLTDGMTMTRYFELRPGANLLLVAVRDPATTAMGSVRIPLDKLKAEGN